MKIKPLHVFLGLGALIGIGLIAQKTAAGFLRYYISGIGLSFDQSTPVLKVSLAVQNPSNQQFTIQSIVGELFSDSQKIGNISMFQTVTIAPNTQTTLDLIVRLNPLAIVSDLVTIITRGSGNPQVIKLQAFVNANGFVAPLALEYKIS